MDVIIRLFGAGDGLALDELDFLDHLVLELRMLFRSNLFLCFIDNYQ